MQTVKEIEADDWQHLKELLTADFSPRYGFIFRGQRDSTWALESTLTRLIRKTKAVADPRSIEKHQIGIFRKAMRGLRGPNPAPLTDDEAFCLGQHYGLATPLLDWTESPYIAAFFAFENAAPSSTGKRAVWMLNRAEVGRKIDSPEYLSFLEPLQDDNSRIVAQQGLFTKTPTGISVENVLVELGCLDCLTKLVIDDTERLDALNELSLMNIGANSLFPDLHGASLYCNMWLEAFHENWDETNKRLEMARLLVAQHNKETGNPQ